jgi:hypothetical protein
MADTSISHSNPAPTGHAALGPGMSFIGLLQTNSFDQSSPLTSFHRHSIE